MFPLFCILDIARAAGTNLACFLPMEGGTMINIAIIIFILALGGVGFYLTRKA